MNNDNYNTTIKSQSFPMLLNNFENKNDNYFHSDLASSSLKCFKLSLIGIFLLIIFILSLTFNTLLLLTFYKYKRLREKCNKFVMFLTFLNLIGTLLELPFVFTSCMNCRYMSDRIKNFLFFFLINLS